MIKCNADERCPLRLDAAEHLFSPEAKMQTSPVGVPPNGVWQYSSAYAVHRTATIPQSASLTAPFTQGSLFLLKYLIIIAECCKIFLQHKLNNFTDRCVFLFW